MHDREDVVWYNDKYDEFEDETERFMEELEEDILPRIKENGGKYCDCGACSLSLELLSLLEEVI